MSANSIVKSIFATLDFLEPVMFFAVTPLLLVLKVKNCNRFFINVAFLFLPCIFSPREMKNIGERGGEQTDKK